MKVVFIDDQKDICDLMQIILGEELSSDIVCFHETQSAKEYLDEHKQEISIIVCDYNLPKENGIRFFERIEHMNLPFILITGEVYDKDDPALVNFGHKKGCEVMFKPTREKDLVAMIKSMT